MHDINTDKLLTQPDEIVQAKASQLASAEEISIPTLYP
jgi:hypothetical protein